MPSLSSVTSSAQYSPLWPVFDSNDKTSSLMDSSVESLSETRPVTTSTGSKDTPFETLVYDVLSILIQEEEKATYILREALAAESRWQKVLSEQLQNEHSVLHRCNQHASVAQKISNLVTPLTLMGAGAAAIAATGAAALPIGIIALGGLLALDTILDDRIKQQVASWIGRGSDEQTHSWFQRICTAVNVIATAATIPVQGSQATALLSGASRFVSEGVTAHAEYSTNQQKARLTESEHQWEKANQRQRELFGSFQQQTHSIKDLYDMLINISRSTTETSSRICS